ncbi:hypothetical protein [Brucella anthropi]|uniref:hypothetical protein n=1 Tax=Brucella anthropi TaxID=529 RepID=UPI0039879434
MSSASTLPVGGISVDKSYANTCLVYTDIALNPQDATEIIRCYVNTGRPVDKITITCDLSDIHILALYDESYAELTDEGSGTSFIYTMYTEMSGRAVFLVGSKSGDNAIATITVTTSDGSMFSTKIFFGAVIDDNNDGSLPPLTVNGLYQGRLQIPSDPTQYFFTVSLNPSIYSGLVFTPTADSPVAVVLNDIPVYCGNLGELTSSGLKIAYALLSEQSDNTLAYFVAEGSSGAWSSANLSRLEPFTAIGTPQTKPLGGVSRTLPAPTPNLITANRLAPADIADVGLTVLFPSVSSAVAGDYAELYLYINGNDTKSGKTVSNILLATIADPAMAQTVPIPQCDLSGYDTDTVIQIDYQLKAQNGNSKGWSAISEATVDKRYPTILLTSDTDNQPATGVDEDRAHATYFDTNGQVSAGVALDFFLPQNSHAVFSGNTKNVQETTEGDGNTPIVGFTDNLQKGETVALLVQGSAAKATTNFTFAASHCDITLAPDLTVVSADGISTHKTYATVTLNGQPAVSQTVTFTIQNGSAQFVQANGLAVDGDIMSVTANTNSFGVTSDVLFIDTKGAAETVTLSATAAGQTAPEQTFEFIAPADGLMIVPDSAT